MMILFCVVLMGIVMTLMIVIVVGRHGEAKDLYNLSTCCPHWIEKVTCQRHYCLPLFACSVECHFWAYGIQMEAILKLHIANPTTMSKRWTKTLPNSNIPEDPDNPMFGIIHPLFSRNRVDNSIVIY